MMKEKIGVALNQGSRIHYNDHLAPISVIMGIPLLFVEKSEHDLCRSLYPDLQTLLIDYHQFTPEYLIEHFDVLFMSDLWDRKVFREKFQLLEKKHNKVIRNVHCPHGFSDKGFYLSKAANEDITLVYGQNMLDLFKRAGVEENLHHYVITGNYRYTYYKKHKDFFDKLAEDEVFSRFDKPRKTILYAPTWMDLEESSTFFAYYSEILDNVPDDYNLVVKLHPRLELDDTVQYYNIIGRYENRPNIVFVIDFPLVYPILARTDIYISDMSSIGYDFLVFDRPMFFLNRYNLNEEADERMYLTRCGVSVRLEDFPRLYEIIEESLDDDKKRFSQVREEVYRYTFGEERSFEAIKKDITEAYLGSPAP